jgi:tyrosinase
MGITGYKGNRIDIRHEKEPYIVINDSPINIISNKDKTSFSSSLAYGDFSSADELARAVIDAQSALNSPEIDLQPVPEPRIDTGPQINIRRNLARLSDSDRNKFRDAVFLLKERGEYDKYIKFHGFTSTLGHFGPAFFAWHRVFLYKFEQELQRLGSRYADVTIPYWDYTSDNTDQGKSLIWRDDFFGTNGIVNLTWTGEDGNEKKWVLPGYTALSTDIAQRDGVHRNNFSLTDRFVDPVSFNRALRNASYRIFEPSFEAQPHGGAHVILGVGDGDQGQPGGFATAVNDPFFMLLHCNVDRMWAKWQQLMKDRWILNNPGVDYPSTQLADDYYWDKSDSSHTAPHPVHARRSMPDRHNLEDSMWPWDATQSHDDRTDSKLVADMDREIYTPMMVLDHQGLGYEYDNLDPTGFRT